jgi:uncharacterized protein
VEQDAIIVRRLRLEYPGDLDPVVVAGQPEESFVTLGMSLLLPYLEPYLIRSMRQAAPLIKDEKLAADLDLFVGQEGQHYRQHMALNEALRLPGMEKLKALEARLDADYHRYSQTRSLRWNLAYAEGFEAYTSAMALDSFQCHLTDRLHPAVRDLFAWHLIEELEHRTVAFDVYDQVCGGYFFRLLVGLFAQWHLNRFVLRAAGVMLKAGGPAFRQEYGGALRGWWRIKELLWGRVTNFLPKVLSSYLPWYTPHRIVLPPEAKALADHYLAQSIEPNSSTKPARKAFKAASGEEPL